VSDDLIAGLTSDLRPVRPGALRTRLLIGLAVGVVASALLMLAWLGLRADLVAALSTPIFWLKFTFALALSVAGFDAVRRLSRPAGSLRRPLFWVFGIIAATGLAGIVQVVLSPPETIRALVLGGSALVCPIYIVALSLPILVANLLVMRRLAPTALPAAGFAAGLLAGAASAWVYAFHCGEGGLAFITLWYTSGVLAVALLGALLGRWALRW
jgi:hypothetical protein